MMYKKIISLISLSLLLSSAVFSQDNTKNEDVASFLPKKGNFTMSLILGNNNVTDINAGVLPDYTVSSGTKVTPLAANDNFSVKQPASITNLAGVSLRYFLKDNISLSLFGSYGYKFTPGDDAYTGIMPIKDENGNYEYGTEIPAVDGVAETKNHKLYASVGVDYHYKAKPAIKNLDFYTGVRFNFMMENLEKTQISWLEKRNELGEYQHTVQGPGAGPATANAIGFGGALIGGVDYYLSNAFFIGAELNVANFMYQHTEIVKVPGGMGAAQHTTTMDVFSYPRFKIGFKIF